MPQLPTPPTSRAGSEFPESKASTECLDDLLERYLGLLDQQQKLQAELAKQLSSGFFALAQANFSCPPGRRYGSDYYDERMKATRNISIKSERDPNISEELQESESATDAPDSVTFSIELSSNASEDAEENDTAPSSKETPEPSEPTATETTSSESTPDEKPEVRKKFRSNDPIHWYGILVPQSLRKAQSTFTAVVDNQVPDLASTALEMRALEQRISKLQAQLESED